jgi:hypothetical protein
LTFALSWFLLANETFKKRVAYGIVIVALLGLIPQFIVGQGYYGINSVKKYFSAEMVHFYRQSAYNAAYYKFPVPAVAVLGKPGSTVVVSNKPSSATSYSTIGFDSSFQTGAGILSYVKSFVYAILGPLPWQIKNLRQSLVLFETLPWYVLLFFIIDGIVVVFKKRAKEAIPLLIFSIIVLIVITVFDNNFGLIVRIRIPAFIALLCLAPFGFNKNNIIYRIAEKSYKSVLGAAGSVV